MSDNGKVVSKKLKAKSMPIEEKLQLKDTAKTGYLKEEDHLKQESVNAPDKMDTTTSEKKSEVEKSSEGSRIDQSINKKAVKTLGQPVTDGPQSILETPEWNCKFEDMPEAAGGKPLDQWDVGRIYSLNCEGDYVLPFKSKPYIEFDKENAKKLKYSLNILKVEKSDGNSASFLVTSYKPGSYQGQMVLITDGTTKFKAKLNPWGVKTVLEQGKQPQGFGPIGAMPIQWPIWYLASFIGLGVVLLFFAVRILIKRHNRKKLIEELRTHGTALSPFNQCNKDLRKLYRNFSRTTMSSKKVDNEVYVEFVEDLDKNFKLYLSREFIIPALKWKQKDVLKELKNKHRYIYDEFSKDINKVYRELAQALNHKESLNDVDSEQLLKMIQDLTEKLFNLKRKRQK